MSSSANFGENVGTILSGTTNSSYAVPAGRYAIFIATVTGGAGAGISITVNGSTRTTTSLFALAAGTWISKSCIANAGETISWSFSNPTTPSYRILVMYKATPP